MMLVVVPHDPIPPEDKELREMLLLAGIRPDVPEDQRRFAAIIKYTERRMLWSVRWLKTFVWLLSSVVVAAISAIIGLLTRDIK